MTLADLKRVHWEYLVARRESPLFWSLVTFAYQNFSRVTKIPWRVTAELRSADGLYYRAEELAGLRRILREGGPPLLLRFVRLTRQALSRHDRLSKELERIDWRRRSDRDLRRGLSRFITSALRAHNFLLPMPQAGNVLSQLILSKLPPAPEEQRYRWLSDLGYPTKENAHSREQRSFFRLAIAEKQGRNIDRRIERHAVEYGWIGSRGFWFERAWTPADIRTRLGSFRRQGRNPHRELRYLNAIQGEAARKTSVLLRKLKIKRGSTFFQLVQLAKEYAFRRTYRTDTIYRAGFRCRELFREVSRRAGFPPKDAMYLTWMDLTRMASSKRRLMSRKQIERRKAFLASVMLGRRYTILSGAAWARKLRGFVIPVRIRKDIVNGNTAFPGKVRGVVKVVRRVDEIDKVERGDILVTIMTFPNFVPAMEKAAAFVTDEGGILSHAAIVSREMRKPCVIGTKVATRVFKDGDVVEVDATRGVIRRIEKRRRET